MDKAGGGDTDGGAAGGEEAVLSAVETALLPPPLTVTLTPTPAEPPFAPPTAVFTPVPGPLTTDEIDEAADFILRSSSPLRPEASKRSCEDGATPRPKPPAIKPPPSRF